MTERVFLLGFDGANPDLIKRYVDEGVMPNVARLMERGVFARYLSSVPPTTIVNWTTIATGAHPGTHGITDFWLHFHGDPLDQFHDAFDSNLVQAEQIWYTAERAGKRALVMNYPVGYPINLQNGLFIGGEGTPYSGSIFEIRTSSCFASAVVAAEIEGAEVIDLATTGEERRGTLTLLPSQGAAPKGPTYDLRLQSTASTAIDTLEVLVADGETLTTLREREWSDWLAAGFEMDGKERTGRFRFFLSELSPDGERLKLYVSQIWPEDGYTQPESLAAELLQVAGRIWRIVEPAPTGAAGTTSAPGSPRCAIRGIGWLNLLASFRCETHRRAENRRPEPGFGLSDRN